MSSPDIVQTATKSGSGILIFDIDNNHEFVRRIDIPSFAKYKGLRGFEGNLANTSLYYTTEITDSTGLLGRFDMETEEVIWEKQLAGIGDRLTSAPDGSRLFIPSGYWIRGFEGGNVVVDALTGEILRFHKYGTSPHMSLVTPNGKHLLAAGAHWLAFVDLETEKVINFAGDTALAWDKKVAIEDDLGDGGIAPITVDSKSQYAYFCHHDHVGFDIVDLQKGEVIHHISVRNSKGAPLGRRSYGIGMTPDEKEIWLVAYNHTQLWVFDNTVMPPVLKTTVPVNGPGHGWVHFSRDGKYAWNHTSDVIDTQTKKTVATLKDGEGNLVSGAKYFEAHFDDDGKLVWVGSQAGMGHAYQDTLTTHIYKNRNNHTPPKAKAKQHTGNRYKVNGSIVSGNQESQKILDEQTDQNNQSQQNHRANPFLEYIVETP